MCRYLRFPVLSLAVVVVTGFLSADANAQAPPSPVGPWFGIARSCTTNSRFPQPPNTIDQAICRDACQGVTCPMATFPVDEVVMTPEFFADGTMVATDHASLVDGHPIGQAAGNTPARR